MTRIKAKPTTFLLLLFLSLGIIHSAGTQIIPINETFRVWKMAVDEQNVYIADTTSIYIYSQKDFKLVKKAGRAGSGPGEFQRIYDLSPTKTQLVVYGLAILYYFTKSGEYISEKRTLDQSLSIIKPFGDLLVCKQHISGEKTNFNAFSLFDSNLKKTKELARYKDSKLGQKNTFNPIEAYPSYFISGNKVYINDGDLTINAYDKTGKKVQSISLPIEKVKVPGDFRGKYIESAKKNKRIKSIVEMLEHTFEFPSYFPGTWFCKIDDSKIYVVTRKKVKTGYECLVLDLNGKLIRRTAVPIFSELPIEAGICEIYHDKFYQMIDNDEKEIYELHITPF